MDWPWNFKRQVLASLARIEKALQTEQKEITTMALDITALQTAVANEMECRWVYGSPLPDLQAAVTANTPAAPAN